MKTLKAGLILSAVLALAVTGCKTPVGERRIHGNRDTTRQDAPPSPPYDGGTTTITSENPPPPVPPIDPTTKVQDKTIFAAQTVYFVLDSATIRAAEKSKVDVVASYLQGHPQDMVLVEGNCDERGTEEYNRALGERRALAGREALLAAGIAPERIDIITYGEDNPAEVGHDEAVWQKNRRAAFVLLSPSK